MSTPPTPSAPRTTGSRRDSSAARVHNLNAGPGALPLAALERAQRELLSFPGAGMSVLEMSHRAPPFEGILRRAEEAVLALYGLSREGEHEALFLQGGASLQFAMVPLHFGAGGAYVNTGEWATRALAEARLAWGEGGAREAWSSAASGFDEVPQGPLAAEAAAGAPYLHYTSNNTIYGTQLRAHPTLAGAARRPPLVVDASSDFLSRPLDLSACDLVYAGAQKNAGPAGVTVALMRRSAARAAPADPRCPTVLRYSTHALAGSLYHTPPTFAIYMVALVAEWALAQGGLAALEARAARRAGEVYARLDAHPDLYQGHARPHSRSHMNITFRLPTPALEAALLREAEAASLVGLKGHRSVGGLRASLYNAVTDEAVGALLGALDRFARAGA